MGSSSLRDGLDQIPLQCEAGWRISPTRGGRSVTMTKWEYKIINIRSENYRLDPNAGLAAQRSR